MTKLEVRNHIAGFEKILTDLDRELNAPVLDGTPFVFALPREGSPMAHWLVYGDLYEDQLPTDPNEAARTTGFRLQRRFDLCGCTSTTEERARKWLLDLLPKFPTATYIHKRDWLRSSREQVILAVNHLQTVLKSL